MSSGEVIALSTVEKLGTAEAYYICPANQLTAIVTDKPDDLPEFEVYKKSGIKMILFQPKRSIFIIFGGLLNFKESIIYHFRFLVQYVGEPQHECHDKSPQPFPRL